MDLLDVLCQRRVGEEMKQNDTLEDVVEYTTPGEVVDKLRSCLRYEQPTPVESYTERTVREAADMIEHLVKMLNYIGSSDVGGKELYPVGPYKYEYDKDYNLINTGDWIFLHGRGDTFIEAVEDAMIKDGSIT
jgi:hypothetical protein